MHAKVRAEAGGEARTSSHVILTFRFGAELRDHLSLRAAGRNA